MSASVVRGREDRVLWVLLAAAVAASLAIAWGGPSADLSALAMAGLVHAEGMPELVYAVGAERFTMQPPAEWGDHAHAAGIENAHYPYIYPPLWAVLAGRLVPHVGFGALSAGVLLVNHVLLLVTVWLAWRAAGRPLPAVRYVPLACAALLLTLPGHTALIQNQPQILVAALVVLALERERAGAWRLAGAAMALAAALKGFPAVFALVWLAAGAWRPTAAFAVVGAGLALSSVALAGWSLHADFLGVLASISNTALVNNVLFGLHPLVAQVQTLPADMLVVRTDMIQPDGVAVSYFAIPKGETWRLAGPLLLVLGAAGAGAAMRRAAAETRFRLLWPMTLIGLTFLSPLPWVYSYIAGLAFLPALGAALGRAGLVAAVALVAPLAPAAAGWIAGLDVLQVPFAAYGAVAMASLAGLFGLAAWRTEARADPSATVARRAPGQSEAT